MRNSALFIVTAVSAAIALDTHAGPLGGLGGGLSGGLGGVSGQIGGNLGGQLGGVGGSLDGRLGGDLQLTPTERAAAAARAEARRAKADAKRAARDAKRAVRTASDAPTVSSSLSAQALTGVATAARATTGTVGGLVGAARTAPPHVVAVAPVFGLPAAEARVIRGRQSAALFEGGVAVLSEPAAYVYMDRQADELRHELAGTGVQVTRQGEAIVLEMPSDVTFAFDKYDVRLRFYRALDAVANSLNDFPATYVDVIGHTDAIGTAAYNQALSERRAGSVADFIGQREEIAARMYVAGRGKFEPIASNATIEGRAANRRVEILLYPYVQ